MTWAAPRTWVAGEMATAALLNQHARDNFKALVPQAASVNTAETTTSTTYADLATAGPSVTVNTFTAAYVFWGGFLTNSNAAVWSIMSYELNSAGATTIAASDTWHALHKVEAATFNLYTTKLHRRENLNAGSNVFKVKYRVTAGTGTFSDRNILVIPVGPA